MVLQRGVDRRSATNAHTSAGAARSSIECVDEVASPRIAGGYAAVPWRAVATAATTELANGLTISFAEGDDRTDPDRPTIVLLPGPTDSWRSYQPVLDRLPAGIHAVAVSPRGHGDSTKPDHGYDVGDLAADVPLLLDALGIGRAVLAGHSGSCLVARRVAIDHPHRVAGLVLESSPSTLAGHAGLQAFVADVVAGLTDPIDPEFARAFVIDTSTENQPDLLDVLVEEVRKVPAAVWRQLFDGLARYDDRDELTRITAPTLLVWGDADTLVDHAHQADLLRRIDGATLRTYAGVGHTPRWEDPDRFAADVADFVLTARRSSGPPPP